MSYTRTGGFAGIFEQLLVRRSGQATLVRRPGGSADAFKLSCSRLRALRIALDRARFATLERVYAPELPISDGFIDRVVYGGRSVRVETEATVPARLGRVLRLLRGLTDS